VTRLWPEGEPVEAWGKEGRASPNAETPAGFTWGGAPHPILEVCNRWRVHTRWWEPGERVWREYLKVATAGGMLCLIYRDLIGGGWFFARRYD
jgi:hypothetical protein